MKNLKILLTIAFVSICALAYSQAPPADSTTENDGRPISQVFDSLSTGLIPSRIPYGLLYDRVSPWSALDVWQDGDTLHEARLFQVWWDLEESYIDSNTRPHQYNGMRELVWNSLQDLRLPLITAAYRFGKFADSAVADGRLRIENGFIFDNNLPATPYDTATVRLAGIAASKVDSGRTYLLALPTALVLTNLEQALTSVQVEDLTENLSYTLTPGAEVPIAFNQTGDHMLSFTLSFADGSIAHSKQLLSVLGSYAKTTGADCDPTSELIEARLTFKGYEEQDATKSYGDYHIYYHYTSPGSGVCERVLRKPIVILDGFDPLDKRQYDQIYERYLKFGGGNLGDDLRNEGYDVVILNFPVLGSTINGNFGTSTPNLKIPETVAKSGGGTVNRKGRDGGADYIERNAYVFIGLVEKLNVILGNNGSTEKLVVVGPSMGGLISRYGLAFMEKASLFYGLSDHNTRLWVSFDSPNWGANVPIGLQQALNFYGNTGGIQAAKDAYKNQLRSPAARQLLIEQTDGLNSTSTFRTNLKNLFQTYGYPDKLRRIALINGSSTGQKTLHDGARAVKGVAYEKVLSAHIKVFENEIYFIPPYNVKSLTFKGLVSEKKFTLLGGYFNQYSDSKDTKNINPNGGMDAAPGGTFTGLEEFYKDTDKALRDKKVSIIDWNTPWSLHCFIPSVSAIGHYWANDITWQNSFSLNTLTCMNLTPFAAIYAPINNEAHVTLTDANVAWLKNELNPIGNITGPDYPKACQKSLYTLNAPLPAGSSLSWSTAAPFQLQPLSPGLVFVKPNYAGATGTFKATITYANCVKRDISFTTKGTTDATYALNFTGLPNCNWQASVTPVGLGDNYHWTSTGFYNNPITTSPNYYPPGTNGFVPGTGGQVIWVSVGGGVCQSSGASVLYFNKTFDKTGSGCDPDVTAPLPSPYRKVAPGASEIVEVSPNPTNSDWRLIIGNPDAKNIEATLKDAAGRTLWNRQTTEGTFGIPVIPGEGLSAGIYFLYMRIDGKAHQFKLIKQ